MDCVDLHLVCSSSILEQVKLELEMHWVEKTGITALILHQVQNMIKNISINDLRYGQNVETLFRVV